MMAVSTVALVAAALQKYITAQNSRAFDHHDPIEFDHDVLATLVSRIEVQSTQLAISLKPTDRSTESVTLSIPWQKPPSKRFRKILMPHAAVREDIRPKRESRDPPVAGAAAQSIVATAKPSLDFIEQPPNAPIRCSIQILTKGGSTPAARGRSRSKEQAASTMLPRAAEPKFWTWKAPALMNW